MIAALHRLMLGFVSFALGCDEPNVLADLDLPSAADRWEAIATRTADQGPFFELGLSKMRNYDPDADNRLRALNVWLEQSGPGRLDNSISGIDDDPSYAIREVTLAAHYRLLGSAGLDEVMKWLLVCAHNRPWPRVTMCREHLEALASRPREVLAMVTRQRLPFEMDQRMLTMLIALLDEIVLREPSLVDDPALIAWLDRYTADRDAACSTGAVAETRTGWNWTSRRLSPWRRN